MILNQFTTWSRFTTKLLIMTRQQNSAGY